MLRPKPFIRSVHMKEGFDKQSYPFTIPAVAHLDNLHFHEDVTFFVGENGSGKSTILEAIALVMGFGAQGGTRNVRMEDAGGLSGLHEHLKAKKSYERPKDGYFLRAESFYNVASYMDEVGYLAGYGGTSLHRQSHGESFMATLSINFEVRAYIYSTNQKRRFLQRDNLQRWLEFMILCKTGLNLSSLRTHQS